MATPKVPFGESPFVCARGIDHHRADGLAADRSQVQLVEQVVEVRTEIQFAVLAQNGQMRQAESLAEGGVERRVPRPAQRVAGNARRRWNPAAGQVRRREIGRGRIREVAAAQLKSGVAVVGFGPAQVGGADCDYGRKLPLRPGVETLRV